MNGEESLRFKALERRAEQLERRAEEAEQRVEAFACGEVDAVARPGLATPLLLHTAQENLRRSEETLRAVFEGALEPMVLTDRDGKYVRVNRAACELYGLPRERLLGRRFGELVVIPVPSEEDAVTFRQRGHLRGRCPVVRSDGTRRVVEYSSVSNVAPGLDLSVMRDVTERHLALEALRASEERYRRIVEGISEGVWMYDARGVTTFMNTRMAEMLGYESHEAVGVPMYTLLDPREHAEATARMARRLQGISERGDFRFRRKDGTGFLGAVQANALLDAEGRFEAGLVLVTDVSAERRSGEERARLAAIVESSEDAIIGADVDGRVTSWNLGAERLYQYRAEEMTGESILRLTPPDLFEEERLILARAARGESVGQYETFRLRKDGSKIDVAVTLSPVRDARGAVMGVSKIVRDLTSRRAAEAAHRHTEEQLRQAQKMEAIGRLAGGVAHDFNNLLLVILSFSELAMIDLRRGDPMRADLEEVQTAARRAAELTQQLLAFSRQQVLQPRVIDLNHSLVGMQRMLGRLLGEDVELSLSPSSDLGLVLADPGQIEQVIMNLAVNARDAMPSGGKLTLETRNVELDVDYASTHAGAVAGSYVLLAMTDTGTGMDQATIARIFEPFFTTKDKSKGTGLGLSTVLGIVQQSGGHVAVYSEPGRGTTFKVYLRRTDRPIDAAVGSDPPQVLRRGTETILLVEDDPQVKAVACAILRRSGYRVLDAANGGEALLIAGDPSTKIHLMMTDVVMPRMSGRELAEKLAPQRPEMRVLFTSGYTDDAIVHHGVLEAGVAFLHKPFTPDSLLRKVREILDARDPPLPGAAAND
jgi:PAS domain S-box-containing protein